MVSVAGKQRKRYPGEAQAQPRPGVEFLGVGAMADC